MEKVADKYFTKSEVVYRTSDGVIFYEEAFAKAHAAKNGLTTEEIRKPEKKVKNGTK